MDARTPVRALQAEVSRLREENRALRQQLDTVRSYIHSLNDLYDLSCSLDENTDVVGFLAEVLAASLESVGSYDGSLLLVDDATGELVFAVVQGQARKRLQGYRLPAGEGIAGWVLEQGKPRIVEDARLDPFFYPAVDQEMDFFTRTMTCVPLMDGDRRLGVIEAVNKTTNQLFTETDLDFLVVLAAMVSQALVKAEKAASA